MPNWRLTISKGFDFVSRVDDDKIFFFWADDQKDAEDWVVSNWNKLTEGDRAYFQVSLEVVVSHGGFRPGAGRPKINSSDRKPPTTTIRLPIEIAKKDELIAMIEILRDWKSREQASSSTSPRWEKLRELIQDIDALGLI